MELKYFTIGFLSGFLIVLVLLAITYKKIYEAFPSDDIVKYLWYILLFVFVLFAIIVISLFINRSKKEKKPNNKPVIVDSREYVEVLKQTKRINSELRGLKLE